MAREFEYCIEKGNIIRKDVPVSFVEKELKEAEYDLSMAKLSLENRDVKWATVKAYYSIFHSIRALVYSKGYREKSHFCLMAAFKHLFVEKGMLAELLDYFYYAMNAREGADYGAVYNDKTAAKVIAYAVATSGSMMFFPVFFVFLLFSFFLLFSSPPNEHNFKYELQEDNVCHKTYMERPYGW